VVTGKDRQKQLAREHHQRQMQARAERQQKARRTAIIGTTTAVVVVIGGIVAATALLGGNDNNVATASASASAAPSDTAAAAADPKPYDPATGTCGYVADPGSGQVKDVGMPPAKVSTAPATMTIKTNLGDIVATLDPAKAPCTVGSFRFLASKNYFDNTKCHRLGTTFPILQCGDPLAKADGKNPTDGQGGPGYRFVDENLEGAKYTRGVLAMANSGPNTNGSQFFIVFGDTGLDPAYTPFGTVTKGLGILDKVAKQGILPGGTGDGTGAPKQPVEIKHVTITGKS
jgi:peptidyl-prolyl cis-trans isomerase B (cyclophilin B)